MKEAGFGETRVELLTGPDSMVIGIKGAQACFAAPGTVTKDGHLTFVNRKIAKGPMVGTEPQLHRRHQ